MPKPHTLRLPLPDDLLEWIETQADDLGCDAATWIRMQLVAMRKAASGLVSMPTVFRAQPVSVPPEACQGEAEPMQDAWRGPVEDEPSDAAPAAIDAVVEKALIMTEASGPDAGPLPPIEMFAKSPDAAAAPNGATRALSVPPRRYSGANQPPGL